MNKMTITLLTVLFCSGASWAAKPTLNFKGSSALPLPICEKEKSAAATHKVELSGGLQSLPAGILVARQAHFSIEARSVEGSLVKAQTFQSFVNSGSNIKSKPKVICGNSELPLKTRYSMMGPTLIYTGEASKEKNIFWQFQVLADSTLLSPWNTRSLALSSSADIEKTLTSLGYETKIYQLSSKKFEIVYSQKRNDDKQALSIIYDFN